MNIESTLPQGATTEAKTVLVVDDDEMVRALEASILSSQGYKVLQANGAGEAMLLAGPNSNINLLLTDFSMPDIDGLELTRQFRSVHPETPVLLVSGSLPQMESQTRDMRLVDVLAKPFVFNELLEKVRALISAAAAIRRDGTKTETATTS
jgi:two-component system cell cycle sensor histidine kinase/response regulator CckA